MTITRKFTVAPAEGNTGKWILRSMSAQKATTEYAWGTFGIKTNLLGIYSTKELAIEAMRAAVRGTK